MRRRTLARKAVCAACSLALALMMVPATAVEALGVTMKLQGDLVVSDDDVTVWGTDGLTMLAESVAAGETYQGKTVRLTEDVDFSDLENWTPIGSKEHPFCGIFDGQGHTISYLTISGSSYLGLFGYVGAGGVLKNLTLDNVKVSSYEDKQFLQCVGTLAGYVFGAVGQDSYAIQNCKTKDCSLTMESAMPVRNKVPAGLGSEEEKKYLDKFRDRYYPGCDVKPGISSMGSAFGYIGGLVGYCAGSIASCESNTAISIVDHQACDNNYSGVGEAIGGIVGQCGGYVISEDVEEKDGVRFKPFYPTAEGEYAQSGVVSLVTHCVNKASIITAVDGEGGIDRFGQTTFTSVNNVGGIVGYSMANVDDCLNAIAYKSESRKAGEGDGEGLSTVQWPLTGIICQTGDSVGGIVGCLRGVSFTGTNVALSDAGSYLGEASPALSVTNCINSSGIMALHAGAGIVGAAGAYTTVSYCANVNDKANILGIRWNKPTCGGVVGQTYGDVTYCYNSSTLESYTHGGYFMAGVVGMNCRFEKSQSDDFDSPVPVVANCYFSGAILGGENFNPGSIMGENEGACRDCYSTASTKVVATNYGSIAETVVNEVSSSAMQSKDMVALLNSSCSLADFQAGRCFLVSGDTSEDSDNAFPILHTSVLDNPASVTYGKQGTGVSVLEATIIDAAKIAAEGDAVASYSAQGNPIPAASLSYDGTKLVARADYYLIPDGQAVNEDGFCKDVDSLAGVALTAQVAGLGQYAGSTEGSGWQGIPYTVKKADFSTCTVTFKSKVYNFQAQWPDNVSDEDGSDLVVTDAAGNRIPCSDFAIVTKNEGQCVNYKVTQVKVGDGTRDYIGYPIDVEASEDSNYTGTQRGYFAINKGDLFGSNCQFGGFTYGGKTWYWEPSTKLGETDDYLYSLDAQGNRVEGMSIVYNGTSIKPQVVSLSFKNGQGGYTELRNGTGHSTREDYDYRLVYGDPGTSSKVISADTANPNVNVSSAKGEAGTRACVTVRSFNTLLTCQFTNYYNFFFDIVQADVAKDCKVVVPSSMTYTGGKPVVKVYGNTGALIPASNYTVSISSVNPGKRAVAITGKNNLKGKVVKYVTIKAPTVKKPSKVKSVTVGARLAKVVWTRAPSVTGYQIAYRVKGTKSWKYKTVKGAKSYKATLKKLKKGKRYQVRVRAYKTVAGKKFYSSYTSIKLSKVVK